jgi:hypothetical protein
MPGHERQRALVRAYQADFAEPALVLLARALAEDFTSCTAVPNREGEPVDIF